MLRHFGKETFTHLEEEILIYTMLSINGKKI